MEMLCRRVIKQPNQWAPLKLRIVIPYKISILLNGKVIKIIMEKITLMVHYHLKGIHIKKLESLPKI